MTAAKTKLIIDPKKWLGDNKILKMDWDVRAMHFHLMLIAWQNDPQGCIEAEEKVLAKYLSISLPSEDWSQRIFPQLSGSWQKKQIEKDGKVYFVQSGLIKEIEKQTKPVKAKKSSTKIQSALTSEIAPGSQESLGFNLLSVISQDSQEQKESEAQESPLSEQDQKEQSQTIWSLGISLLQSEDFSSSKARSLLGKLAKEHGPTKLSQAIASIGMKKVSPIEARSYLIAYLKNNATGAVKKTPFTHHNQASGKMIL